MELFDKLTRVVLIGGNGTGKTFMLDAYVAKIAKEKQMDRVLFAIHQKSSNLGYLQLGPMKTAPLLNKHY